MVLTPLEIYNKEFKKSLRGYNEEDVDAFIDKVMTDYEKLYKENLDLLEQLEQYKVNIQQYKKIEETLHNSIIVAQQTAEEVKRNADERASLLVQKAEQQANEILREAEERVTKARHSYQELIQKTNLFKIQLRAYFKAQLEALDEEIESIQPKAE